MNKSTLIIVLFLNTFLNLYSQTENLKLPESTPPSPDAFAITKYGDGI